jgi:hypothetical protein
MRPPLPKILVAATHYSAHMETLFKVLIYMSKYSFTYALYARSWVSALYVGLRRGKGEGGPNPCTEIYLLNDSEHPA